MAISITYLGSTSDSGGSGTTLSVDNIDTTGAKALVIAAKHDGAATTITPSANNDATGWTSLPKRSYSGGEPHAQIFYKLNPTGAVGDDPQIALAASRTWKYLAVWKITADNNVELIDETSAEGVGTSRNAGNLVATAASVAVYLDTIWTGGAHTPGGTWTERYDVDAGAFDRTGTGAETYAASSTFSGGDLWVGVAAAFQEVGAPAAQRPAGLNSETPVTDPDLAYAAADVLPQVAPSLAWAALYGVAGGGTTLTIAATEGADTSSVSVNQTNNATITASESADTSSVSVNQTNDVVIAAIEGADASSISVSVGADVTLTVSALEDADTSSFSINQINGIVIGAIENEDSSSLQALVENLINLNLVEDPDSSSLQAELLYLVTVASFESNDASSITIDVEGATPPVDGWYKKMVRRRRT